MEDPYPRSAETGSLKRGMERLQVILPVLLVLCSCAYFNTYYNARRNYEQARESALRFPDDPTSMEAELLDKAITGAAKVLTNYPESSWADDAQLLLADALLLSGERTLTGSGTSDFEEAMMAYAAAVVMTDDRSIRDRGHIGMGHAAVRLGRFGDAIASFENVSTEDDRLFFQSRLELIEALLLDGQSGVALDVADSLAVPGDDSLAAELLLVEGMAMTAAGHPDSGAMLELEAGELFGRGEGSYRALLAAAESFILADEPYSAVEVLNDLLSTYRSDMEAAAIALLEGKARDLAGEPDRAITSYANAADLDGFREYGAEALYLRVLLLEDKGRMEEALSDLAELSQRSGDYIWIRLAFDRMHDLQLLNDYMDDLESADDEDTWLLRLMIAEKRMDLYGSEDPSAVGELAAVASGGPDMERAMAMVGLAERVVTDPDSSVAMMMEARELATEGDLATEIEGFLGLEPGPGFDRRPSVVLERSRELIEEQRFQQAWSRLTDVLESRWSESIRPELLWTAYVAAEGARMDDGIMESYLTELSEDYAGSELGRAALNRLGGAEESEEEE